MTDEGQPTDNASQADDAAAPATSPAPRSKLKTCCLGSLGIVVALVLLFVILNLTASPGLDAKLEEVKADIQTRRTADAEARSSFLGDTVEGNAVHDYNGIEWVFAGGDTEQMRMSWRTTEPVLPEGARELATSLADTEYSLTVQSNMLAHMEKGEELTPEAQAQFEAYRPLIAYVQQGLRKDHCDWEFQYERHVRAPIPNLLDVRNVANLLAFEAFTAEDSSDAVERALEIVAFGDDMCTQPTLIGLMIGIAVKSIGFESLERTLRTRADLGVTDYQRVLDVLTRAPRTLVRPAMELEKLGFRACILEMTGRPLSDDPYTGNFFDVFAMGSQLSDESGSVGTPLVGDWLLSRELEGYDSYMTQLIDICDKPLQERQALADALVDDLTGSGHIIAQVAIPNLYEAGKVVDEVNLIQDLVRMLAAAHLHRLETGTFPSELADIQARLGAPTNDPFSADGNPLSLTLEEGRLRCYSVYENGTDEGGVNPNEDHRDETADLVFSTEVPEAR